MTHIQQFEDKFIKDFYEYIYDKDVIDKSSRDEVIDDYISERILAMPIEEQNFIVKIYDPIELFIEYEEEYGDIGARIKDNKDSTNTLRVHIIRSMLLFAKFLKILHNCKRVIK